VIGNRIPANLVDAVSQGLEENDLFLAGMIPNDDEVAKLNYMGKPVFDLPQDSPAFQAVEKIAEKLGLLSEVTLLKLLGQ
jgi:CO dehydrogenase nickel-insertion accessory protein CooC1